MSAPPCFGKSELFDSTDAADHLVARELCWVCPVREWCSTQRGSKGEGTWGGRLYGAPANAVRMLREDETWSDADTRRAHSDFVHYGKRDAKTRVGERVYQRRIKAQHKKVVA